MAQLTNVYHGELEIRAEYLKQRTMDFEDALNITVNKPGPLFC